MKLGNKLYDATKQVAQVWLPTMVTLYVTLAPVWHWPDADQVSKTGIAVDAALGVLLGISTLVYKASGAQFDGTMTVHDTDDGSTLHITGLDPVAVNTQPKVTLKVQTVNSTTPVPQAPPQNMTDPRLMSES